MIYAHLYNRGVEKRNIFLKTKDYDRFMLSIRTNLLTHTPQISTLLRQKTTGLLPSISQKHLNEHFGPPMLEILCFCLMPNHYHLLVKSKSKQNISKFAQRLGNSYTLFFNTKYSRKGRLFESKYQMVSVETEDQLVHLCRYIHTNPANTKQNLLKNKSLKQYLWSSLPAYLKGRNFAYRL